MTERFEHQKAELLREADKLHQRLELSKTVGPDWYEPGQMEHLDQSEGIWDEAAGRLLLRFESRGTRYDGRTELIEELSSLDVLSMSPMDALNRLFLLREKARKL